MKIKELREKANITQEELSLETGIPRTRIAKWEQGKGNPKQPDFDVLKDYFIDKKLWEEVPRKTANATEDPQAPYKKSDTNDEYLSIIRTQSEVINSLKEAIESLSKVLKPPEAQEPPKNASAPLKKINPAG